MLAMAVQVDQLHVAVNQADDDDANADTESQVPTCSVTLWKNFTVASYVLLCVCMMRLPSHAKKGLDPDYATR